MVMRAEEKVVVGQDPTGDPMAMRVLLSLDDEMTDAEHGDEASRREPVGSDASETSKLHDSICGDSLIGPCSSWGLSSSRRGWRRWLP